jgi:hypothetical protein
MFLFVALVFFVAPTARAAADRYEQRRREVERCGRVQWPTQAPRFDRDPSPRPRRRVS